MRKKRITIDSSKAEAAYLCRCLFAPDVTADERFSDIWDSLMRKASDFSGVAVESYGFESAQFELTLHVPLRLKLSNEEVFRRYWTFNNPELKHNRARYKRERKALEEQTLEMLDWCESQRRRMFDVSEFVKMINERFASVYNREVGRRGSVFQQHFESAVYQPDCKVARMAEPQIDMLQPGATQTNIADRKSTVLQTSLARANSGDERARAVIQQRTGCETWEGARARYIEHLESTMREQEKRPLSERLIAEMDDWDRSGGYLDHCHSGSRQLELLVGCCAFGTAIFAAKVLEAYRSHRNRGGLRREPVTLAGVGAGSTVSALSRSTKALRPGS